jgi:hypothetical protein
MPEPLEPGLGIRRLAAGRSHRDIAADLFISAKTASVYVSNIVSKLGVASRIELRHVVIPARSKRASATFLAGTLDLRPGRSGNGAFWSGSATASPWTT